MSKLILIMGDSGSGKNNYKIYKLTCLKNNKVYIGATCQSVKNRWRNEECQLFTN